MFLGGLSSTFPYVADCYFLKKTIHSKLLFLLTAELRFFNLHISSTYHLLTWTLAAVPSLSDGSNPLQNLLQNVTTNCSKHNGFNHILCKSYSTKAVLRCKNSKAHNIFDQNTGSSNSLWKPGTLVSLKWQLKQSSKSNSMGFLIFISSKTLVKWCRTITHKKLPQVLMQWPLAFQKCIGFLDITFNYLILSYRLLLPIQIDNNWITKS